MNRTTADADMLTALVDVREVLQTARKYFPKSIRNTDRFSLENVLANAINPAIEKAEALKERTA